MSKNAQIKDVLANEWDYETFKGYFTISANINPFKVNDGEGVFYPLGSKHEMRAEAVQPLTQMRILLTEASQALVWMYFLT